MMTSPRCFVEIDGVQRTIGVASPLTIGSDPQGANCVVYGPGVSPIHCRIQASGDGFAFVDLSSTGSYVGFEQEHVQQRWVMLEPGTTEIHLGDPVGPVVTARFEPPSSMAPASPPAPIASEADPAAASAPPTGSTEYAHLPAPPPRHAPEPKKPIWKRWWLYVGLGVAAFIAFGVWQASKTTAAEDLEAGDCFALPDGDEFTEVRNQGCDGDHEAEILSAVTLPPGPYPTDFETVYLERCQVLIPTIVVEQLPDDAILDIIFPLEEAWDDGDRTINCYVYSETGLTEPVPRR